MKGIYHYQFTQMLLACWFNLLPGNLYFDGLCNIYWNVHDVIAGFFSKITIVFCLIDGLQKGTKMFSKHRLVVYVLLLWVFVKRVFLPLNFLISY